MNEFITIKFAKERILLAYLKLNKEKSRVIDKTCLVTSGLSAEDSADLVRQFIKKNFPRKPLVINIFPSNLVMPKNIEIPSINEKEIKEIIDLQAIRHTPYSRNEIVTDYAVTGVFHERYSKVMLTIGKKEIIQDQINILRLARCNPDRVVLEAEAISNWCWRLMPEEAREKPAAVIHLDLFSSDFSVIYRQKSIFIRSLPLDKAELLKNETAKENFFSEISKSLEAYNSENIEQAPEALYLISSFNFPESFLAEISEKIKIKTLFLDYSRSPLFPVLPDNLKSQDNISFFPLLVCPPVLPDLNSNLMPEDLKMQKELQEKAKDATKIAVFVMLGIVIIFSYLFTKIFFKQIYLQEINQKYIAENEKANILNDISGRTAVVKRFVAQKGKVLDALVKLVSAMPEEVYFNSVVFRSDSTLTITATADTMSRVFSLVTILENNESFTNVKVDFTRSRVVGGKEIADFGITMNFSG